MKRKILLVDDDTSLLATLGDFLTSEGYHAITADSAERALTILKRTKPDLIVLDMSMPGMGGMGFLDRITGPDGSTRFPVLVLTARAMMAEYFANKQVDGFIAKPCDPGDLAMEISRIIFQRSGGVAAKAVEKLERVPRVLLGESDKRHHEDVRQALTAANLDVESVFRGPDVIEAAVVNRPDAIVLRLELDGMSADQVVRTLRQMSKTGDVPIVLYGLGAPDAQIEHVAAIDEKTCHLLPGLAVGPILSAVRALLHT